MRRELRFEGMTCLDCAKRLERALAAIPGVQTAEVSYATKRGVVVGDDTVPEEELLRAAQRTGYRAEVVREPQASAAAVAAPASRPTDGAADFDLLIIGSGAAGMAAAIRASELGATAAVVEGAEVVGGTCVNIGCIPSKFLIEAAHHLHSARSAFAGIGACDPRVAWREVLARKREIVEALRREKYLDVLDAYEGVSLLRGRARLLGGGRVQVGEQEVSARKILVATGASPAIPPIPGIAEAGALDSTSVMELEELPASLVVIGGGSIGLEIGQAFARFGVRVVVIEAQERILPGEDAEVSAALREALAAEGIELHVGVKVLEVDRDGREVVVRVEDGSLVGEVRAERLLVATGRAPNTRELGLETAGVEVDVRGFIRTDEFMRTANPDVFAAGDVTGGPGYVYVAAYEGGIAAQAALAELSGEAPIPADLRAVPRVTFTDPQVASVGMTEEEARATGVRPKVTSLPIEHLARAAVSRRGRGVIQLVADADSDRLLGAHLVATNAGDVVGEAALAIRFGLRVQELVSTMHPYLTWGEGLKLAGQTFTKEIAKLSCCA